MNVLIIASPNGTVVGVGWAARSVHDTAAARIWNVLAALRKTG
jgi:hypothetical protein